MTLSLKHSAFVFAVTGATFFLGRTISAFVKLGSEKRCNSTLFRNPGTGDDMYNIDHSRVRVIQPISHSLKEQVQAQLIVQLLIDQTQNPFRCDESRYLLRSGIPAKDGLASEMQYVARLLQIAASTGRTLVFKKGWVSAYSPRLCTTGYECLWKRVTNCTSYEPGKHHGNVENVSKFVESIDNPMVYGILARRNQYRSSMVAAKRDFLPDNPWFDPIPYGIRQSIAAPVSFPLKYSTVVMDTIPHYERMYGRHWIRSQMSHYVSMLNDFTLP